MSGWMLLAIVWVCCLGIVVELIDRAPHIDP